MALPLALIFVLAVGALLEFVVYRPLRNTSPLARLVASLGVLLIAQSSMLLAFGITQQPAPSVLPTTLIHMLGSGITLDRFLLAAIVVAATVVLAAVYKWTKFGLATRAASENEVAAMLSGVSPGTISLTNSLIAAFLAGSLGILASSVTQLDPSTLPLQIIPALAAALIARFTSFGLATAAAFGIGILDSLLQLASTESWFPQSGGVAIPGTTDLLAFLIIIGVLFWRGRSIPGRGEVQETRLPQAPRPQHLFRSALIFGGGAAVLLVVFPFDFRNALINTLIGILMALSLVIITGFVGQISIIQLALAGAAGFTISHMASNFGITFPLAALAGIAVAVALGILTAISAVRVRGTSLSVVTLAGAVAIDNFGFQNPTWGGGGLGSPVPEMHWFGVDFGPNAGFRGIDGNQPSPVFGWVVLICVRARLRRRRLPAARQARPADARRPLQRARGGRRRDQPADRKAVRVHHRGLHRGRRRMPVRLQLRLGERRPVRRLHRAIADRVRLRGRHHAHLWRGVRGPDLRPGADPVRPPKVVRPGRELVPAGRRRPADLHAAAEPGRRGRRPLPPPAQAAAGPRAAGGRRDPRASRAAHGAPRPVGPSGRPHGRRPVRAVRRRARAVGGVAQRPRGRARRAHRPERRRQDHPHRRHLRLRDQRGNRPARRA